MMKARNYFLSIWTIIDPIYFRLTRLVYIVSEKDSNNVFRVRLTKYKGRCVTLSDGTFIGKNDILLKIHLHNVRLLRELSGTKAEIAKGRHIFNRVKSSLPDLAIYLQNHPERDRVKGIIGITMLTKGCGRLGFETHPIKNGLYRFMKQIVFVSMYSIAVCQFSTKKMVGQPKYLFMSQKQLFERYLVK